MIIGSPIAIDNICFGEENGLIYADTTFGGMAPYSYSLDSEYFQADSIFVGLGAGNYPVYYGCQWMCGRTIGLCQLAR